MSTAQNLVADRCHISTVCTSLGVSRATFYRRRKPRPAREKPQRSIPANRLSDEERSQILSVLHAPEYIDQCPREIVPKLVDQGIYLGSIRTFYRLLGEHNEIHERRKQARRPAIAAPILEATAPNQVWTWDITRVPGPYQGKWFFLFWMLDLYSRYGVGWMIAERENARLAQHFIRETVRKHLPEGGELTVHNDRGSPMIAGSTQEMMMSMGVSQSFSRPRTSDDNPFSEAQFRTAKYHWTMPPFFETKEAATAHFDQFMAWYNYDHMHSGLNLLTPAMVHFGTANDIVASRQKVMNVAFELHPERFSRGMPQVKSNPTTVGINTRLKAAKVVAESPNSERIACALEAISVL